MLIKTTIDVSGALATCDLILKKIPYATNNALTRTAQELVELERGELVKEFHIRTDFTLKRVKIMKYSKAGSLWTYVGIDQSNVKGGDMLLTMFEEGGTKEPERGSELAVPLTGGPARPSMDQTIKPSLLYKQLRMMPHVTSGGNTQYKGDRRTFVIPGLGIFQRVGGSAKKRGANVRIGKTFIGRGGAVLRETTSTVMLYSFKQSVPLRAQMHFVKTAREFVNKRFAIVWRHELVKELAGRAKN